MFLFRALASGSSGNAYLLKTAQSAVLFDAGIRLPALRKFLSHDNVSIEDLKGVLISHEHRDHALVAVDMAGQCGISLYANAPALRAVGACDLPSARVLPVAGTVILGDVEISTFAVPHDAVSPVGFRVRLGDRTVVIATDLGEPTEDVLAAVAEADLVVLEANHDSDMLARGRYPAHLRRRVGGPTGHLSNAQAGSMLVRALKGPQVEIWLAHLSRENNTPALAVKSVRKNLMAAGLGGARVQVALRDRPSLSWTGIPRPQQLSLFSQLEAV